MPSASSRPTATASATAPTRAAGSPGTAPAGNGRPPPAGAAREYAKTWARNLPDGEKHESAWKKRSLSSAGTTAMLVQAATDPRLTVTINDLDAHPWELNTPAGIIDLRTGELTPATPPSSTPASPAAPPTWPPTTTSGPGSSPTPSAETPGDLIAYLRRLVGYSAVGIVGPHVLPFCHGSGGNGKGVFLEVLRQGPRRLRHHRTQRLPHGLRPRSHETEIARLAGARMVLCSEVNEDDRFDEAKVKQLTGGDTLTARFMRQDHFTFTPSHHLWLMGNHQASRPLRRPIILAPPAASSRSSTKSPKTRSSTTSKGSSSRDHGPAILGWIIAGAVQYAAGGLREPESVKAATADYAHDQDTVGRFVEECCRVGGGEHVTIKIGVVRAAYERWCLSEGEQPVTAKAFGQALSRRFGIDSKRTKQARLYVGLSLIGDENASPDDEPDDDASPPEGDFWSRGMAS
jgi:putative DNA primase/helicase